MSFVLVPAKLMAAELGIANVQALNDTQNFSAWVKLLKQGNPTDPFVLDALMHQAPATGRAHAVIMHTHAGHPADHVERSIRGQMQD